MHMNLYAHTRILKVGRKCVVMPLHTWWEKLTLIGQAVPHLCYHPWTAVISENFPTNLQVGGNSFCCIFSSSDLLSATFRLSTANMTSTATICGETPAATCSTKPSRPDPQSWRILLSGKIYCDLGKDRKNPKKLCFVFLCFLLVCVIDALCGGKSGINFFQLNLVFSHHKNRSSSNLGVVPSIYFLP